MMEFFGGFTIAAGAVLRLVGNRFIASVDVPGGFTNHGTIELSNVAAESFNCNTSRKE